MLPVISAKGLIDSRAQLFAAKPYEDPRLARTLSSPHSIRLIGRWHMPI